MKNWMIVVAFLVVALVAAPAIAQDEPGDGGNDAPFPKASPDTPPTEAPPTEAPAPADPTSETTTTEAPAPADPAPVVSPTIEESAPVISDDTSLTPGHSGVTGTEADDVADIGTGDGTNADTNDAGPVEEVSNDLGDGARDDTVQDQDKDDADAEKKAADTDKADAEDREDRIADRILDDLEDGKEDEKKDEKKDDADDEEGVEQNTDQDADSGDTDQDVDVINTGDNVNQCVAVLQVANTGNAQNANGVVQYDAEAGEIELEDGSTIDITPRLVLKCKQVIRQVVRSERIKDSDAKKLRTLLQPRSVAAPIVRAGGVPTRIGGAPSRVSNVPGRVSAGAAVPTSRLGGAGATKTLSTSRSSGQPKAASLRSLPRTGGSYATVLGLSAGALLIGGGLLVRRLAR